MASSHPTLQTKTEILSPATLAQSPHLPAMVKLINYTYDQSHINSGLLPPGPTTRLRSLSQLSSELDPDGFTILTFSPEHRLHGECIEGLTTNADNGATLIATASAKPYVPTEPKGEEIGHKGHLLFKRPPPGASLPEMNSEGGMSDDYDDKEGSWPKWEILAIAVHPSLQNRGLASTLLGRVIEEIKTRSIPFKTPTKHPHPHHQNSTSRPETTPNNDGEAAKGKVMLMLSTMLELNESYYLKRGFATTAVRRFEPGTMGSRGGFGVVEMMRWVDL